MFLAAIDIYRLHQREGGASQRRGSALPRGRFGRCLMFSGTLKFPDGRRLEQVRNFCFGCGYCTGRVTCRFCQSRNADRSTALPNFLYNSSCASLWNLAFVQSSNLDILSSLIRRCQEASSRDRQCRLHRTCNSPAWNRICDPSAGLIRTSPINCSTGQHTADCAR